jgi:hypothetical protein
MASISNGPQGRRTIQFVGKDGKRRTIRLGKATLRVADETKLRVERLVTASTSNTSIDRETAEWLSKVGDDLAEKLAKCGLCEPRKPMGCQARQARTLSVDCSYSLLGKRGEVVRGSGCYKHRRPVVL